MFVIQVWTLVQVFFVSSSLLLIQIIIQTFLKTFKVIQLNKSLPVSVCVGLQVTFTSLDLMLHTEALLSAINFLSTALSSGSSMPSSGRDIRLKTEDRTVSAKSSQ